MCEIKNSKEVKLSDRFGSDASAVVNAAVMWLKQLLLNLLTPIICQSI